MVRDNSRQNRLRRKQAKDRHDRQGGPFAVQHSSQLPIRPKVPNVLRKLPESEDFRKLGCTDTILVLQMLRERPKDRATWKGLNQGFAEFIIVGGSYNDWLRKYRNANPHLRHHSIKEESGYFVRSALWHWRSWKIDSRDEETFVENDWPIDEKGEMMALVHVIEQIFGDNVDNGDDLRQEEETRQRLAELTVADEDHEPSEEEEVEDPHHGLGISEYLTALAEQELDDLEDNPDDIPRSPGFYEELAETREQMRMEAAEKLENEEYEREERRELRQEEKRNAKREVVPAPTHWDKDSDDEE